MRTSFVNGLALFVFAATSIGATLDTGGHTPSFSTRPTYDSLTTKADLGRIQGSPTAKIWVVEIGDLQCPSCKVWHDQAYGAVRDEFVKTGKVRFAYINFPLPQHEHAMQAATAVMCASAQGKFWEMQDSLYTNQATWEVLPDPMSYFEATATKLGTNVPTWKSCLTSKSIHDLIQADMSRAERAGVQATPSFIIDGKLIERGRSPAEMRQLINDALGGKP